MKVRMAEGKTHHHHHPAPTAGDRHRTESPGGLRPGREPKTSHLHLIKSSARKTLTPASRDVITHSCPAQDREDADGCSLSTPTEPRTNLPSIRDPTQTLSPTEPRTNLPSIRDPTQTLSPTEPRTNLPSIRDPTQTLSPTESRTNLPSIRDPTQTLSPTEPRANLPSIRDPTQTLSPTEPRANLPSIRDPTQTLSPTESRTNLPSIRDPTQTLSPTESRTNLPSIRDPTQTLSPTEPRTNLPSIRDPTQTLSPTEQRTNLTKNKDPMQTLSPTEQRTNPTSNKHHIRTPINITGNKNPKQTPCPLKPHFSPTKQCVKGTAPPASQVVVEEDGLTHKRCSTSKQQRDSCGELALQEDSAGLTERERPPAQDTTLGRKTSMAKPRPGEISASLSPHHSDSTRGSLPGKQKRGVWPEDPDGGSRATPGGSGQDEGQGRRSRVRFSVTLESPECSVLLPGVCDGGAGVRTRQPRRPSREEAGGGGQGGGRGTLLYRSRRQKLMDRRRDVTDQPAPAPPPAPHSVLGPAHHVGSMLELRVRALDHVISHCFPKDSLMVRHQTHPRRFQRTPGLHSRWQAAYHVLLLQEALVRLGSARLRRQRRRTEAQSRSTDRADDTASRDQRSPGERVTPEGQSSDEEAPPTLVPEPRPHKPQTDTCQTRPPQDRPRKQKSSTESCVHARRTDTRDKAGHHSTPEPQGRSDQGEEKPSGSGGDSVDHKHTGTHLPHLKPCNSQWRVGNTHTRCHSASCLDGCVEVDSVGLLKRAFLLLTKRRQIDRRMNYFKTWAPRIFHQLLKNGLNMPLETQALPPEGGTCQSSDRRSDPPHTPGNSTRQVSRPFSAGAQPKQKFMLDRSLQPRTWEQAADVPATEGGHQRVSPPDRSPSLLALTPPSLPPSTSADRSALGQAVPPLHGTASCQAVPTLHGTASCQAVPTLHGTASCQAVPPLHGTASCQAASQSKENMRRQLKPTFVTASPHKPGTSPLYRFRATVPRDALHTRGLADWEPPLTDRMRQRIRDVSLIYGSSRCHKLRGHVHEDVVSSWSAKKDDAQ
ncbi:uncharacterized protein LOC143290339 [Babylonia areolata]|uniref:uncharacterized protein LOC143290339 n=1 Tax=Babylonia areolata TaxID=304850 RepID=UPI003FD0B6FC